MTFYKETGRLHSMADSRTSIPLKKDIVLSSPTGIWLGTTVDYVQQYYGSFDPDDPDEFPKDRFEVRCEFQYNTEYKLKGTDSIQGTNDPGNEFAVLKCSLISAYNVTKKEKML